MSAQESDRKPKSKFLSKFLRRSRSGRKDVSDSRLSDSGSETLQDRSFASSHNLSRSEHDGIGSRSLEDRYDGRTGSASGTGSASRINRADNRGSAGTDGIDGSTGTDGTDGSTGIDRTDASAGDRNTAGSDGSKNVSPRQKKTSGIRSPGARSAGKGRTPNSEHNHNRESSIESVLDESTLLGERRSALEVDSGPEYDLEDIMSDDADHADHSSSFAMLEVDRERDLQTFFDELPGDALSFPKYTRINRKSNKSPKGLDQLFLAQELRCSPADASDSDESSGYDEPPARSSEVLVMEFSRDGKYLAVAGRDSNITVWQVISSPLSRLKYKSHEAASHTAPPSRKRQPWLKAPVFLQEPVRVFEGHSKSVLCLDWSKNNFLVSGSMDKTVKLWNVDRPRCLETFSHDDFVTAVRFHPNDDRFFMSTALDNQIRLWSIMESCVAYSNHLGDEVLATAMSFTPSGDTCVVGGFNGSLVAVETQGCHIKKSYNIKSKSRRGHDAEITGIQLFKNPASEPSSGDCEGLNMLISTTDNRISLVDISRGKVVTRFKGSSNKGSSMRASVSEDHSLVICGSEDHWCYVWSNNNSIINNKLRSALKELMRESKSSISEKHKSLPRVLHDNKLWKKIPVHKFLDSNDDYIPNDNSSYAAFHAHHSRVNIAIFAPQSTKKLLKFSDDVIFDLVKRGIDISDSPNSHVDEDKQLDNGHIIVTCDSSGLIRIYRQDPAYYIRKNLIELKKVYDKELTRQRSASINSNIHNLKIDLTSLNSKIIKTRSMSPAHESASLRSQFHHKIKSGHRNSMSTLKRNGSSYQAKSSASFRARSPQQTEKSSYFSSSARRHDFPATHSTDSSDAEYSVTENNSPLRLGETRGRNRRGSSLADSDYPHSILSPLIGTHFAMKSAESLHSRY